MPNYCENRLTVTGPKEDLERFYNQLKVDDKDRKQYLFDTIYEIPESFEHSFIPILANTREEYALNMLKERDPYWFREMMGCKWEPEIHYAELNDQELLVDFTTPWNPPDNGIITISSKYPSLVFDLKYLELGACFAGIFQVQNGEVLSNEEINNDVAALYKFDENYMGGDYYIRCSVCDAPHEEHSYEQEETCYDCGGKLIEI